MSDLFGWELVYKLSQSSIKKKEDDLVLLIHFMLVKNGFKCIGLGDDKTLTGSEKEEEVLPEGWSDTNSYSIRYKSNGHLYILHGVPVNDSIVYNLLQVSNLAVTNVAFEPSQTVKALTGSISEIFNNYEELMNRIRVDLIEPVLHRNSSEATTQTKDDTKDNRNHFSDPLASGLPRHPTTDPFWSDPERDPLRVGRSDLDPFRIGGGGGMIFNPFEPRRDTFPDPGMGVPGGLPRGSVPPGARFDPFGPPTGSRRPPRPPPDSNHFHPPGSYDSMFL